MALSSTKAVVIGNESLQNWKVIGFGGFGVVYRARHKDWGFDVAIKLLRYDDGHMEPALGREADKMGEASSPFVLMVLGEYCGCPPDVGSYKRVGIVMEFMERGSLRALQQSLCGPPPWPLAFRLAHQVALGMNFLHRETPLLHGDLKPDNVMLDKDLNAKLTDFGLSRVSTSVLRTSNSGTEQTGGTLAYMPPEALVLPYKPVRAYDIYSYGILLWSILTGKEPYPGARADMVLLRIPLGDRPPTEEIDPGKAVGLGELVELMKKCWDKEPSERPPFGKCIEVTDSAFLRHKRGINDAVHQVLKKLDPDITEDSADAGEGVAFQSGHPPVDVLKISTPPPAQSKSAVDVETEDPSKQIPQNQNTGAFWVDREDSQFVTNKQQDVADGLTPELSDRDKAKFVDEHKATLIQHVSMVMAIVEQLGNKVHPEMYSQIEAKGTSQAKMRMLFMPLHSGGEKIKAAFYDALKKHEPHLVDRLGG